MRRFLYLLTITEEGTKRSPFHYETNRAFVVRARSSKKARELAELELGAEPARTWLDPFYSKCRKIGEATPGTSLKEEVVCQDNIGA